MVCVSLCGYSSTWHHQASLMAPLRLTGNTKDSTCLSNQRFSRFKKMCIVLPDFLTPIMNHLRMTRQPPTPTQTLTLCGALRSAQRSAQTACLASLQALKCSAASDLSMAQRFPSLIQMGRHTEDADGVWQGVHAPPCPYRSVIHRSVSSQSSQLWSFQWSWMAGRSDVELK